MQRASSFCIGLGHRKNPLFLLWLHTFQENPFIHSPARCEGKPFCTIEIKVEPLSHLIFHKTLLHMIPTAKLISQANIRGNRLNPYGVISGNIVLSQRHICYYAGCCKSRRQSVHFGGIRKRQANTVSSYGIMPRVSSKSAIISR